jgi:hypothetical protein
MTPGRGRPSRLRRRRRACGVGRRIAGNPADRLHLTRRWSRPVLAHDLASRSGSRGIQATERDDVERDRRHRQHPAPRVEQPADQVEPGPASSPRSHSATISRLPRACPRAVRSPEKRCCRTSRHWCPHGVSSHSAASAIRRSPGGRTSNSSRSRPLDPPSSATVTTAVMVGDQAAARTARRPDRARRRGRRPSAALTRAPGRGARRRSRRVLGRSVRRRAARHRHRAVLATGAADGDRGIAAPLAQVALEHGAP